MKHYARRAGRCSTVATGSRNNPAYGLVVHPRSEVDARGRAGRVRLRPDGLCIMPALCGIAIVVMIYCAARRIRDRPSSGRWLASSRSATASCSCSPGSACSTSSGLLRRRRVHRAVRRRPRPNARRRLDTAYRRLPSGVAPRPPLRVPVVPLHRRCDARPRVRHQSGPGIYFVVAFTPVVAGVRRRSASRLPGATAMAGCAAPRCSAVVTEPG